MKKRINYTQRQRIPKKNIQISLNKENDKLVNFDANINLQGFNLPFDAQVFVEAYYRTERKRFHFGTVSNISQPKDTDLSDLGYLDNLDFRIKVVDTSTKYGLILAEADKIKPREEGKEENHIRSILATEFNCDLGNQIWRLNFTHSPPVLELNNKIPNIRSLAKTDPLFFFYVYPQVVKEVLIYLFLIEEFDPEDPLEDWHSNWFEFSKKIYPEKLPGKLNPSDPDSKQEIIEWINNVTYEFSLNEMAKWDQFVKILDEGFSK